MSTRLFAAVLTAALTLSACQGSSPTGAGTQLGSLAKGQGLIKGIVTTSGVIAAGGGNYRLLQAGTPVPGASMTVQGGSFTGEFSTGPDGSFSIPVPGGSTYTLTASHPDGQGGIMKQVAVVAVPLADEPPIVDVASLVTRRTGSIQGVVALAGGGDPEGADVFVPGTTIVGKVSQKGRFALANVPEGTWNIVFQKPGYARAALTDLAVQAGRPLVLTEAITLQAGGTEGSSLKGLIRDAQGKAVIGANVTATNAQGAGFTAVSDDQGNVTIPGLAAGTYRVQVYRSFYQVPSAKEVTVEAGKDADLGTVSLTSTVMHFGKIAGRLLDEAGEPIDGAVVMLDPPTTEQVFTDARGNFTLDRVMPGEYTLRASAGGFEVGERDVLVDNRPGFTANVGAGFTLRAPFDPAKPKAADRKAATLLPPVVKVRREGNDLIISWEPVGLPPGVNWLVYDLEGQAAPGAFFHLATTDGNQLTLKDFGTGPANFRLTVRPPSVSAAAYRTAQASSIGGVSTGIGVGSINIQGMDLETALMMVQAERTKLLDAQLQSQIQEVQNRNAAIATLNEQLNAKNAERAKTKDAAKLKLIDADIAKLKAQIDALGNSQQMDMLRLQSLSNKRNEAFDVMTNFVKKMQESRSSIIGNMR